MTTTARQTGRSAKRSVPSLWWVPAASMLVPMAAIAQANACDQLKATLAARIEATGVRGYVLEVVPSATAVPAGAKAIGNCEGGARKVLYRRWGGASGAPNAEAAAVPALLSPSAVAPEPSPVLPPAVRPIVQEPVPLNMAPVPVPATVLAGVPAPTEPPLSQRISDFLFTRWRWLLVLLLVPLAVLGWLWRAHHLAYDKNGLPRGPRL